MNEKIFFKKISARGQVASLLDWKMLPAEFGLFLADSDEKDSCRKYQWSEEFVKMETFLLFQTKQARHSKHKLSQPSEINNMRWVFALSRQSDIPNLNYQSHLYSTTEYSCS